jgi:hypothetical protein
MKTAWPTAAALITDFSLASVADASPRNPRSTYTVNHDANYDTVIGPKVFGPRTKVLAPRKRGHSGTGAVPREPLP